MNLATGRTITLNNEPDQRYNNGGSFTLVNGISGRLPWKGSEWLGFTGTNLEAVIDLGQPENVSKITLGLLHAEGSWIYLPKEVTIALSLDGNNFRVAGKKTTDEGEVVLYNVAARSKRTVEKFENVPAIVFSSDSTRLITGDFDGYVQAWDVTNGELLLDLLSNETEIMSLSSAANQLAVGLQDKLLILDVQTGDTIAVIDSPGDHQLMAFSQGGSLLAANNTSG